MKKNLIALSVAAALAAASMVASAATPNAFYVGARGGYAHTDWDNSGTFVESQDDAGYGLGIYGGYNFNEYFAIEAGYNYFDGFSAQTIGGAYASDFDFHGPEIAAKVNFPVASSVDLYLRGGLMYAWGDADGADSNKIVPLVGAGVQFACTDNLGIRLGYDRYFNAWDDDDLVASGVDMDLDFAYVGLQYTFGTPAPAPQPEPEPVTKTITTSYSLDANTLFAFDSSTLSPEGTQAVDQILTDTQSNKMADAKYTVIGHTDRLGAEAYNQKLSERRAQVVADELVAKGVPATDIVVEGRGETEPVTGNKCDGLKRSDLIVCYGPDRRVEINVTGTTTTTETVPADTL